MKGLMASEVFSSWGNACSHGIKSKKEKWDLRLFLARDRSLLPGYVGFACGCACVGRHRDSRVCRPVGSNVLWLLSFGLCWNVTYSLGLPSRQEWRTNGGLRRPLRIACSHFALFWSSECRSLFRFQPPGKSNVTPEIPKSFPQHSSMYFIFPTCTKEMSFPNVFMCWLRGKYFWSYN